MNKNRSKITTFIIFLITVSFLIYSIIIKNDSLVYKQIQPVMGTIFTIIIYDNTDEVIAQKYSNEAFKIAHNIEAKLSRFKSDSELSKVNANPTICHNISDEFLNCVKHALNVSKFTNGYFDITFLPLYEIWDFRNNNINEPSPELINKLLKNVGWQKIYLNENKKCIKLEENMKIDLGGIAKCYTVGYIANYLKNNGINDAIVSGGGDLVITHNRKYVIGVQDPFSNERGKLIGKLIVNGPAGIFTSGDYEQFKIINGKKYSHVINPHTGYPSQGLKSVTIVSKDYDLIAGYSAGIMAMGDKLATKFVEENNIAALLIYDSSEIYISSSLSKIAIFKKI